jgi:hypothetical protein
MPMLQHDIDEISKATDAFCLQFRITDPVIVGALRSYSIDMFRFGGASFKNYLSQDTRFQVLMQKMSEAV